MLKFRALPVAVFPLLIYVILTTESILSKESDTNFGTKSNTADTIPCSELHITHVGVSCLSSFNTPLHLDFPKVNLKRVLAGNEFLPDAERKFGLGELVTANEQYRNISVGLHWEPATPDFLQIYLKDYLPYWGYQIPYRLFWSFNYEVCSSGECTEWTRFERKGEILPSDIPNLPSDLAADSNFNGVPAAFWNTNVIP